jgi:CMP-N-acetylneuraminic acid synthetase
MKNLKNMNSDPLVTLAILNAITAVIVALVVVAS